VADRTHDGQPFRSLNLIDEYSRKCLALRVRRELKAQDVVEVLAEQFFQKGLPAHLRLDNGPEFTAKVVEI
jgi:transposase InsO family protein